VRSIYRSDQARRAVEDRYRAFLRRWPVSAEEFVVPTRHGDTFVLACGPHDAPPVLLLHGAGFNSVAWMGDVACWSQTLRVYAVDVIGEPGLSAPTRPPLKSDAYAGWLDGVLDGLGIEQASFVGTSLGGWLVLDYALRRPQRVMRLALLAPGGIGRQKYGAVALSLLLMPFGGRGRRAAVGLVLGPTPAAPQPPAQAATSQAFADFLLLILSSYRPRRDRLPIFTDDQLRDLTVPLLVIAGAKDRMLDAQATARRIQRLIPAAIVTLLPDTGHVPTGYVKYVHEFLTARGRS
jgi:pimeloyl-ACP methyl ester carboxylesterase